MVYRLILLCNQLLRERNKYLQNIQFTNVDAYAKIQAQTNNNALIYNLIKHISRNGGIGRRKGLKIPRWKHRIGSTPIFGTNKKITPLGDFFYLATIGALPVRSRDWPVVSNR